MSDTPRTDAMEWEVRSEGEYHDVVLAEDSRILERELNAAIEHGLAWEKAALTCGLYRADTPHSTPDSWQNAQSSAACKMLDQISRLKADLYFTNARAEKAEKACAEMRSVLELVAKIPDHIVTEEEDLNLEAALKCAEYAGALLARPDGVGLGYIHINGSEVKSLEEQVKNYASLCRSGDAGDLDEWADSCDASLSTITKLRGASNDPTTLPIALP